MASLPAITLGEAIIVFGLVLNILGVYALTVSGVIGKKPARTWWYLCRHVDRDDPENPDVESPVKNFGPVGGGFANVVPPTSTDAYDSVSRMARNQTLGVGALFCGFSLQVIGTLL
jgi:hypothetical protein